MSGGHCHAQQITHAAQSLSSLPTALPPVCACMIDTAMLQQHQTLSCSHTTETSEHPQQLNCSMRTSRLCATQNAPLCVGRQAPNSTCNCLQHAASACAQSSLQQCCSVLAGGCAHHRKYSGTVRLTSVMPAPLGGAWSNCRTNQTAKRTVQTSTYIPAAKADSRILRHIPEPNKLHMQASTCMMASTYSSAQRSRQTGH